VGAAYRALIGFKLHWQLPGGNDAFAGVYGALSLQVGYGGLSLIEGDVANLCLVVLRSALQR